MSKAFFGQRLSRFVRNDIKINLTGRQLSFILLTTDVVNEQENPI